MIPKASGYYQDSESVCYVSGAGTMFYVQGPDDPEPVWRREDEFSEDAERAKDQGRYAEFVRSRMAYGIDA
jgi:hypothetical protein